MTAFPVVEKHCKKILSWKMGRKYCNTVQVIFCLTSWHHGILLSDFCGNPDIWLQQQSDALSLRSRHRQLPNWISTGDESHTSSSAFSIFGVVGASNFHSTFTSLVLLCLLNFVLRTSLHLSFGLLIFRCPQCSHYYIFFSLSLHMP